MSIHDDKPRSAGDEREGRLPPDARPSERSFPQAPRSGEHDAALHELVGRAGGYREPPPVPRDQIWSAVRSGLDASGHLSTAGIHGWGRPRHGSWMRRAAAAVVTLAIGVGAGMWWSETRPAAEVPMVVPVAADVEPAEPTTSVDPGPRDRPLVRRSALEHLRMSEGFLAVIEGEARDGEVDPAVASWAAGLLRQTRLLMDSGTRLEPDMRVLLEDLELVLVQVMDLTGDDPGSIGAREDARLLARGLEEEAISIRIASLLAAEPNAM